MEYISELLNGRIDSHFDIEYVNTYLNTDTRLFIDPMLIKIGSTDFCRTAKIVVDDYFKAFYDAYNHSDRIENMDLLSHAQEINDNHLGYGTKLRGKGNTKFGLMYILSNVAQFISDVKLTQSYELVLFVPNFAEDGMSDLLTNILYRLLSEFTISQCEKYGVEVSDINCERFYWDAVSHTWQKYNGKALLYRDKPVLLLPKEIVNTHYRFTVDNFLRSVILENICKEKAYIDLRTGKEERPSKTKIRNELLEVFDKPIDVVHSFVAENNELLDQYPTILNKKYRNLVIDDQELDKQLKI